jgi:prepilin-type N-terminal cleavage/methylation domain-containing protein
MRSQGFTILEITVVLAIAAVMLGISGLYMTGYLTRSSARRAAQVFSRDLAQARSFATRSREGVTIRFVEDSLSYRVESDGGRLLAWRRFQPQDEVTLSELDLELDGDTLRFDPRGLASLPGLGAAVFSAGANRYEVRFNGTGTSRVEAR